MKTILFLILIGLGAISCNSSRNMVKLTGVKWVLEKMDGKPLQMKENGNKVYIHFNDTEKRADGMAGCNRFFGGYEMDGKTLKFSQMGSTRMACPDMEVESAFFKMLESTDRFEIKDHKLLLMQGNQVLGEFRTEPLKQE